MENDVLLWLENWYLSQCDGDWEHDWSVKIGTLDNPGWHVQINVDRTELQTLPFVPVKNLRTEDDWIVCQVRDHVFDGAGGPQNLRDILVIFRDWANQATAA